MHKEGAMAVEKLSEGIRHFYEDTGKLEKYVRETAGRVPTNLLYDLVSC